MNTFIDQAEQKIYNSVQLPDLRKNSTGAMTADNKYLTLPTDYLYTHAFAVISAAGRYSYPLVKDASFMREVYPTPTVTGMPKHYAHFSEDVYILGPTPDAAYAVELHYGFYPETIVTATNTWLGDNFDAPLFNGVLLEAMRFMKGEADVIANYEKLYLQSITLLKNYSDGKLRQDNYRSGQVRIPVT
jgi:hypothetical protein